MKDGILVAYVGRAVRIQNLIAVFLMMTVSACYVGIGPDASELGEFERASTDMLEPQSAGSVDVATYRAAPAGKAIKEQYIVVLKDDYVETAREIVSPFGSAYSNYGERYPNSDRSLRTGGLNGFINFSLTDDISFDLSAGYQESRALKAYVETFRTPLTTNDSITRYFDIKGNFFGATIHIDSTTGHQKTLGLTKDDFTYDLDILNTEIEYDFSWKTFSGQGLSY